MEDFSRQLTLLIIDKLIIGALIVLAGYYANKAIERFKGREALQRELEVLRDRTALEHTQAQIEQLYSPLHSLLRYRTILRDLYEERKKLEERRQESKDAAPEERAKVERYFVETYLLPVQEKMADLIKAKIHLIETDEMPESFLKFLRYQAHYEGLHNLWKDERIPSDELHGEEWPEGFGKEVEDSLQRLRKSYNDYLRRIRGAAEHLIPPGARRRPGGQKSEVIQPG